MKKIVVVGNGLMGVSIAQVFAYSSDLQVMVKYVEESEDYYAPIVSNLDIMIERGVITEDVKKSVLSRISFSNKDEDIYPDADFVIECIPEILKLKQQLFADIERLCKKDCIFATNTSVISVTEIAALCENKERVLGAHFWNPGHLIPLVEVVKTEYTDEKYIHATLELLTKVGKKPIYCKKDVPGFIANRLQHALWREAFYMVENGIADPQTVDDACKYGPGLRWPILGPMENSDMVSIELSYNIHNYILQFLADNHEPSKCLKEMLDKGENGFKTEKGWYTWTKEKIENSNRKLREYLIEYNKKRNS